MKGRDKRGPLPHVRKKKTNASEAAASMTVTAAQRASRVHSEALKGYLHLREARAIAGGGKAPNACIHSVYYAMMHFAVACILTAGGVGKAGGAPRDHGTTLLHFERLVRGVEDPDARRVADLLANAKAARIEVDYGTQVSGASAEEARQAVSDANEFVLFCQRHLQLMPDPDA